MEAARHPDEPVWPNLASLRVRDQYRARGETECEECTWYLEDDTKSLAPPQHVRLSSITSTTPATILFNNKSGHRVRVLWLDFEGNEVAYSILEPDSPKRYRTYATHPWIVRDLDSGVRMLLNGRTAVVGMEAEQSVDITGPPELEWTTETHCVFPEECKDRTKALLLSHARLEKAASLGYARPAGQQPRLSPRRAPGGLAVSVGGEGRGGYGPMPCSPKAGPSAVRCEHPVPLSPRRYPTAAPEPAGLKTFSSYTDASPRDQGVTSPPAGRAVSTIAVVASAHVSSPPAPAPELRCVSAPPGPTTPPRRRGMLSTLLHAVKYTLFGSPHVANSAPGSPMRVPTSAPDRSPPKRLHIATSPVAVGQEDAPWPPRGPHLGLMPWHVIMRIIELANTDKGTYRVYQSLYMPPIGRPGILPTILSGPPPPPADTQAEQEAAAAQGGEAPPLLVAAAAGAGDA